MKKQNEIRRAVLRYEKDGRISVMCNIGHLLESINTKEKYYAGSMTQMHVSWHSHEVGDIYDRMATRCQGFGHTEEEYKKLQKTYPKIF